MRFPSPAPAGVAWHREESETAHCTMTTLIVHGTTPVPPPHANRWWWDSWHEGGFLESLARGMRSVSERSEDVWMIDGVPVSARPEFNAQAHGDDAPMHEKLRKMMSLRAPPFMVHEGHFMWLGGDFHSQRDDGGRMLANYLNLIHKTAASEPIRIVAHSHGCNVVKAASSHARLAKSVRIDRAVFLACPHCRIQCGRKIVYPYRIDRRRFGRVINLSSPDDTVQKRLAQQYPGPPEDPRQGIGIWTMERTELDEAAAHLYWNYEIVTEDNGIRAHSATHSSVVGELAGYWLLCDEQDRDELYLSAIEEGGLPVPAGDFGE